MSEEAKAPTVQNSISFAGTHLDVNMNDFLAQHDLVFLTPATKGYEGLPIGNGDLGAMAWTPTNKLHFQINKCDIWDDDSDESFGAWDDINKANKYTYLRHCGQLQIESGLPMLDWMYLEDFKAHLSLSRAKASWFAKSPLGKLTCNSFIARNPKVMVVNYSDNLSEPTTRKIKLARWGTRGFEHWYATIKRDNLMGPMGTKSGSSKDEIWIEQSTRSLHFAMVCKIVTKNSISKLYHTREAGFELDAEKECSFSLYLSVVTSEEASDPLAAAREIVTNAAKEGQEKIFESHKKYWADFWSKSFIDLSQDYLNNLWYLQLYQLGSSSLGKYPPHFINSLWSWTRDARPWNHYYHWNQQHYVWPLLSSGHPELLEPYARWRLEGLPHAIEDAKKIHNCDGAFYSDVANRRGYQDIIDTNDLPSQTQSDDTHWLKTYVVNIQYNITPGAQIASDLWQHYRYTLDEQFLRAYTYPILREYVKFHLDYLKKEEDGLYHIPKANPYETALPCKDTTSCIAYIKLLFPAFAVATDKLGLDDTLALQALGVLNNLAEYVVATVEEDTETSGKVKPGTKIFAGGISGQTGRKLYRGGLKGKDVVPFQEMLYITQLTPIFPAGLIGLNQKETQEFKIAQSTLDTMPDTIHDTGGEGHYPWMVCQARMGYANKIETALIKWVENFQLFPQGMFCYECRNTTLHYPQGQHSNADYLNVESTNRVKVLGENNEYVDIPTEPFAHMGLEAGSTLMTTINEMLLQSIGGKIRVFPAVPLGWPARFTLHGEGGFVVTSEKAGDEVKYVSIASKCGKQCCLVNPWLKGDEIQVIDTLNQKHVASTSDDEIVFSTEVGHVYIIERVTKPLSSFKKASIQFQPNQASKKLQNAVLGKPRQF